MPYLSWVEDQYLIEEVRRILSIAERIMRSSEMNFEKNVIDPFSAIFQMSGFDIDYDTWFISETTRQAQKSLQNHIGDFHQNILGHVAGWENLQTGGIVDLKSTERKIIAEVKNKFNTVKGANLSDLYDSLKDNVMFKSSLYKGFTAYYVTIIPKKPDKFDKAFTPSDKSTGSRKPENPKIRMIDGASFYELVTGVPGSLSHLYCVLPKVINECTDKAIKPNELKKLYKYFLAAYGD